MKLHYKGKYDDNPESIPAKPHKPNCVKFKEPENSKKLAILCAIIVVPILLIFYMPVILNAPQYKSVSLYIAVLLSLLAMFPHEILHAICFKEDVYLFTHFKRGMLFVSGPEDMSKSRFIFMSLLPNIVLGFIPYLTFVFNPTWTILGTFASINIASGVGDYINVFNAITQMPKGSRTYLHHFNSYWYIPLEK